MNSPLGTAAALAPAVGVLACLASCPEVGTQEPPVPDLAGNYIRGDFVGMGESDQRIDDQLLTGEGLRRLNAYDYTTDDPGYGCIPASWTRVRLNPNVVVQITQGPDHVRLRYEFMDLDRVVPLVSDERPIDAVGIEGQPMLGRSVGWYDGDTLVIDTSGYERGYVSTIADWAGLPQSRRMRTVERISGSDDGLTIEITHVDPVVFRRPFVVDLDYASTDFELLEYRCDAEEAAIVAPD